MTEIDVFVDFPTISYLREIKVVAEGLGLASIWPSAYTSFIVDLILSDKATKRDNVNFIHLNQHEIDQFIADSRAIGKGKTGIGVCLILPLFLFH